MRVGWSIAVAALVAGCSGGGEARPTIPPDDIVTLDFVGELAAADTSRWEQFYDGSPDDIYRNTFGGRISDLLVGPATLTLADGTDVDVAARTPGGNMCPQLDLHQQQPDPPPDLRPGEICVVVGEYRPGTTTAAWFATLRLSGSEAGYGVSVGTYDANSALVQVDGSTFVRLPLGPDVVIDCFGLTFAEMLESGPVVGALVDAAFSRVLLLGCVGQE